MSRNRHFVYGPDFTSVTKYRKIYTIMYVYIIYILFGDKIDIITKYVSVLVNLLTVTAIAVLNFFYNSDWLIS